MFGSQKEKNVFKEFLSSAGSGVVVSYLTFPLEGYKKYLAGGLSAQKFYPFKGSTVFAVNIVPTTTIQLMTNGFLDNYFNSASSSIYTKLITSAYCGIQGAIVATLVENCIIRQQIMKCGPKDALKDMLSQSYLRPWKSYPLIATRDGIFTLCMLQVNPVVKTYVKENFTQNTKVYELLASLGVSLLGAFLSHPFDTMATRMQRTHEKMSLHATVNDVMKNLGGYKGFYVGFRYRVGLFFVFSNVIPSVKKYIDNLLSDLNIDNKTQNNQTINIIEKTEALPKKINPLYELHKSKKSNHSLLDQEDYKSYHQSNDNKFKP